MLEMLCKPAVKAHCSSRAHTACNLRFFNHAGLRQSLDQAPAGGSPAADARSPARTWQGQHEAGSSTQGGMPPPPVPCSQGHLLMQRPAAPSLINMMPHVTRKEYHVLLPGAACQCWIEIGLLAANDEGRTWYCSPGIIGHLLASMLSATRISNPP